MTLLWLVACGEAPVSLTSGESLPVAPVDVRVMLDGAPRAGGGDLIVQVEYDDSGSIELPEPSAKGLTFTANGPPTVEDLGGRDVITQRFVYAGTRGNYEITPLSVKWLPGPDDGLDESGAQSTPVFLDIEADPLTAGELADIAEPPAIWAIPWVPVLAIGALFVVGFGVAFWPRRRAATVEPPPVPPHIAALAAWDEVRASSLLTDEDKARELSLIFRRYAEAVFRFEASAWTTSEILGHLKGLEALAEGNVPRANRMLRATDRIKFAEERSTEELIAELDADLRAFVDATRPRVWSDT